MGQKSRVLKFAWISPSPTTPIDPPPGSTSTTERQPDQAFVSVRVVGVVVVENIVIDTTRGTGTTRTESGSETGTTIGDRHPATMTEVNKQFSVEI